MAEAPPRDGRFAMMEEAILEGTGTHVFRVLEAGHRRLYVAVPRAPVPPGGVPSLTMLDGNAALGCLTPALLAEVPDLALVLLGHDGPEAFDRARRWHDYTPPFDPEDGAMRPTGGGGALLEEITGPLRELAETGLRIDPARRTLWGHSLGGLLVLTALFTRPEGFSGYCPVSPSLWMAARTMAALERAARPARARLLVMLGDMESRSTDPPLTAPRPAPEVLELTRRLARCEGLAVEQRILAGQQHGPALRASVPHALRFAARPLAG
ncbi:alpha/beta hydrolase [Pseudoroseicyclus aestuarii]|uniref:Alpha/beta superfamily hydrolase n=1 Tax=Pseudoroseicyclus aestuarii TaxID=1795041 RepID=A0A318SXC9_9RHOB|nr:alpha/beta hydrolase-fold protein [Pseudoroseicyclus aestuarii]PYE84487.1 hypothetical protein DFP88_102287 [Pseudoroseicyclus aestuarii]